MTTPRSTEEWQRLFAEQELSGQSVAAFCADHGLWASYFYRRRREAMGGRCRTLVRAPATPQAFVPVTMTEVSSSIELVIGEATLFLPIGVAPTWLAALLRGLET